MHRGCIVNTPRDDFLAPRLRARYLIGMVGRPKPKDAQKVRQIRVLLTEGDYALVTEGARLDGARELAPWVAGVAIRRAQRIVQTRRGK